MPPLPRGRQSDGMKIFLVENSPHLVKRLSEMLSALPGVVVAGHAAGAKRAIEEIVKLRPQVVLLDIELDQGTGLDVLFALREQAPEIDVYMVTNHDLPALRGLAAKLGAKGYYDKTRDLQALRDLISRRASGTSSES